MCVVCVCACVRALHGALQTCRLLSWTLQDVGLISEVWMLWKSYHVGASFEFLTAQNNFSSNAHTRGQRGEGEEVRVAKGDCRRSPGPSATAATLSCPNLSSPGRAVINY